MLTSLYLMKVLPASMPSAAVKTMMTVGPLLRICCTAIPMATSAARIGMIQMMEIRVRFGGTTLACGSSSRPCGSAIEGLPFARRVPEQTRIEGLRSEHRQHDHSHEEDDTCAR